MNAQLKSFLKGKKVKTVKLNSGCEVKTVRHNGREIVVGACFRSGPLLGSESLAKV